MTCRCAVSISLLALTLFASRPARAAIEATPFMGAMIPANTQLLESGTLIRMQTHTVYGVSLNCSKSEKYGLEAVLGTGTGKMEVIGGSTSLSFASTLFMADLRGRARLLHGENSQLFGVLGVGYTDFNSGLFDLAHEEDMGTFIGRLTGIAGVEMRHEISDRIHLNVGMVDRVHDAGIDLDFGTTGAVQKTQNDIVVTAGLALGL